MSVSKLAAGMAGVALAVVLVSGCSTATGYQKAERSVTSMDNTKAELQEAYVQVTKTVYALDKVMKAQVGDLRPMYEDFVSEAKVLEAAAESARNRALTMQEKNQAYFSSWAQDIDNITNPNIKAQSLQRYKATLASYQKVEQMLVKTRDAYLPVVKGLSELQVSMSQDLTPSAIAPMRAPYGKARQKAIDLQTIMKNTMKAIDDAARQMTPVASGGSM